MLFKNSFSEVNHNYYQEIYIIKKLVGKHDVLGIIRIVNYNKNIFLFLILVNISNDSLTHCEVCIHFFIDA